MRFRYAIDRQSTLARRTAFADTSSRWRIPIARLVRCRSGIAEGAGRYDGNQARVWRNLWK